MLTLTHYENNLTFLNDLLRRIFHNLISSASASVISLTFLKISSTKQQRTGRNLLTLSIFLLLKAFFAFLWNAAHRLNIHLKRSLPLNVTATFRDQFPLYLCKYWKSDSVVAQTCKAMLNFQFPFFFFLTPTGFPCLSPLCCFYSVSQWCSWAVTSTPQKTASMLSSRSMVGVTTPPPTVRGPSSSLTSREKASKRLLTGAQGSNQLFCCF